MKEVSNQSYQFNDYSKDIKNLKSILNNSIYGVFQELQLDLVSPVYLDVPKVHLRYENNFLAIEHIYYIELPNEIEPLVSIVFEGKMVLSLKQLNIEELETVYKLVYSFVN